MQRTHLAGNRTEAMMVGRLAQIYDCVLIPFGDGHRYDLVVDSGDKFLKIQCKTGWIDKGCILFHTSSSHYHRGGKTESYRGQIDFFAVYCPDNGKAYLIPVDEVPQTAGSLRIEPTRNGQSEGIRWAKDYELPA